jgi:Ca2+-transporting ATPase
VLRFLEKFKDPLILLLLGSALLSVLVRQYEDALSIAAAVFIVGSVGFVQEYRSEQSLEALNSLVPPRCNVLRDGQLLNILAEDVVPGDIIRLHAGDRVPADARVLVCNGLAVDESNLTGEQEPRTKVSEPLAEGVSDAEITERRNMVFMGTLVSSGHAMCLVLVTAAATEFGKTFEEMKEIKERRTPLQTKMDELGKTLSVFSFGIIGCICALGIFQGKSFMAMFNIGVSLAVAAIPEGLPICVTVTLALGVMSMARRNAIVKRLPAVEALGCANYICTDKTGTLTENKMTAIRAYCPAMDDAVLLLTPSAAAAVAEGKAADVDILSMDKTSEPVLDSLDRDRDRDRDGGVGRKQRRQSLTGTTGASYNGQAIDVAKVPCLHQLFDAACICNNAQLSGDQLIGQPTEGALLLAARKLGVADRRGSAKRTSEVPFSSESKYMEVT